MRGVTARRVALLALCVFASACSAGNNADGSSTTSTTTKVRTDSANVGLAPEPIPDPTTKVPEKDINGITFADVTKAAGLDRDHSTRDQIGEDGMSAAVSVVDIDEDGWPDIFLSRVGDSNSMYRNNRDGTFTDIEVGLGGQNPEFGTGPAVFFDANGDGHVDVYMAAIGAESDRLYMNDGTGFFIDSTAEAGMFQPPPSQLRNGDQVHGLTVGDVNADGNLDLVAVQWDTAVPESAAVAGAQRESSSGDKRFDRAGNICKSTQKFRNEGFSRVPNSSPNRSRLWINNGDGTFRDGTAEWGVNFDQILAFTPVLNDVDGDGRPDLAITGDACTSRLYRNVDGKKFEDITEAAGVGTDENGMGSTIRDIDGDGDPDWLISSISYPTKTGDCPIVSSITGCSGNRLYINDGDGKFTDATDKFGLRHGWWGWGSAIEDFGNDGKLEVAMANGFSAAEALRPENGDWTQDYFNVFRKDPMRFWVSTKDGYKDAAFQVGLEDFGVGLGLVPVDFNRDGNLDLIMAKSEDPPRLFQNNTPARGWLDVRLEDSGTPGNSNGIGARVEVTVKAGDKPVVGEISTGGSYESQKLPELHVGLGNRKSVAKIDVYWPGESKAQQLSDVKGNQVITIKR
ncbi:MAG: CRTAC1 family protein [Actinobacteria bacterium]|nr:CRTAC1 family protein [Actinomycetota bacterium]